LEALQHPFEWIVMIFHNQNIQVGTPKTIGQAKIAGIIENVINESQPRLMESWIK
jgi:hypothetical protein